MKSGNGLILYLTFEKLGFLEFRIRRHSDGALINDLTFDLGHHVVTCVGHIYATIFIALMNNVETLLANLNFISSPYVLKRTKL